MAKRKPARKTPFLPKGKWYLQRKVVRGIIAAVIGIILVWQITGYLYPPDVITPEKGKAVVAVYATGNVEPVYWSKLASSVTSIVKIILKQEGETVMEGEPVAMLDDTVEQARLIQLRTHYDYLMREKSRQEALFSKGVISRNTLDQVTRDYAEAEAEVMAQEKLLTRLTLRAPMEGTVLRKEIEPGELAVQGTPVFWVGKPSPLRITVDVDEEDIALVTVGKEVLIKADAFPDQVLQGVVGEITPQGDPVKKQFRIRVTLPAGTPLKIGMTTEINIIISETEHALFVPQTAVVKGKVYRKQRWKFVPIPVKTGVVSNDKIQILEGITAEDKLLLYPPEGKL